MRSCRGQRFLASGKCQQRSNRRGGRLSRRKRKQCCGGGDRKKTRSRRAEQSQIPGPQRRLPRGITLGRLFLRLLEALGGHRGAHGFA
jgi:hypothetical protein